MKKEYGNLNAFGKWVVANSKGKEIDNLPEDFNLENEFYYKISELQYGLSERNGYQKSSYKFSKV